MSAERPRLRVLPGGRRPVRARVASCPAPLPPPARSCSSRPCLNPTRRRRGALRPAARVAVFGLARGCGVTVVSRALAAEMAGRDAAGAAAVHCDARAAGIPLATHAAARLAKTLADVPGADTRAVGRLCLVAGAERAALADTARHFAPLVLDAGSASLGGAPAVAGGPGGRRCDGVDRARARLGRSGMPEPTGSRPDRGAEQDRRRRRGRIALAWNDRAALHLPESRMGAQLALGGRETRGELGRAVAELADMCEVGQ